MSPLRPSGGGGLGGVTFSETGVVSLGGSNGDCSFAGEIKEVLVFDLPLDDNAAHTAATYLGQRHGIALAAPAGRAPLDPGASLAAPPPQYLGNAAAVGATAEEGATSLDATAAGAGAVPAARVQLRGATTAGLPPPAGSSSGERQVRQRRQERQQRQYEQQQPPLQQQPPTGGNRVSESLKLLQQMEALKAQLDALMATGGGGADSSGRPPTAAATAPMAKASPPVPMRAPPYQSPQRPSVPLTRAAQRAAGMTPGPVAEHKASSSSSSTSSGSSSSYAPAVVASGGKCGGGDAFAGLSVEGWVPPAQAPMEATQQWEDARKKSLYSITHFEKVTARKHPFHFFQTFAGAIVKC